MFLVLDSGNSFSPDHDLRRCLFIVSCLWTMEMMAADGKENLEIQSERKVIAARWGDRGLAGYLDQDPRELCDTNGVRNQKDQDRLWAGVIQSNEKFDDYQ
jgi:hypothetical protein